VPANGLTTLKVYNLLGAEVATLVMRTLKRALCTAQASRDQFCRADFYFYTLSFGKFCRHKEDVDDEMISLMTQI